MLIFDKLIFLMAVSSLPLALGIGLIWLSLKEAFRQRWILDRPSSRIATAAQGKVELQGFAWPDTRTRPSLFGRHAVYLDLVLERNFLSERVDKNHRRWTPVWSRVHRAPFLVMDSTGFVRVDPAAAKLEVTERVWKWSDLPRHIRESEEIARISTEGFPPLPGLLTPFKAKFQFRERAIFAGAPVHLHGTLTTEGAGQVPCSLPLKRFRGLLRAYQNRGIGAIPGLDRNLDGLVSEDEAAEGMNDYREAMTKAPPAPGEDGPSEAFAAEENRIYGVVTSTPHEPLCIADCHEGPLLARIRKADKMRLFSGAVLIMIGASVLGYFLSEL